MPTRSTYRFCFKVASRGRKHTFGGGVFNGEPLEWLKPNGEVVSAETGKLLYKTLDPENWKPARSTPWNAAGIVGLFIFLPLCATPLAVLLIPIIVIFFILSLA